MTKRIFVDATHSEETRVAVVESERLQEFDFETSTKQTNKGNVYLAKVTRVEPSLQAAFIEYGGNRHGFLAFGEISPDYYQIPVADKEKLEKELAEIANRRKKSDDDDAPELDEDQDGETSEEKTDEKPKKRRSRRKKSVDKGTDKSEEETDSEKSEGSDDSEVIEISLDTEAEETPAPEADTLKTETTEEPVKTAAESVELDPVLEVEIDPGMIVEESDSFVDEDAEVRSEAQEVTTRTSLLQRYKIQEVIKKNQILLVQVVKEERGNKGAALTTYVSLAGRYSVLMPNTANAGGISRKIRSMADRKRLRKILNEIEFPDKHSLIIRTAGQERNKLDIKKDYEFLNRTWEKICEKTVTSIAPALVHEESDIISRAIRDIYTKETEEILVQGADGYKQAKNFMKTLMPSHAKKVKQVKDNEESPFHKHKIEEQIDALQNVEVPLPSGGSIVINQTEALVAIDINSGKSTKERNIDETAYRTNLEAASEIARQLRLRDLAGLVVIDFIDMDNNKHTSNVEKRMREAVRPDRARIQMNRISQFGLLEMSRQRLRPSVFESFTQTCSHCSGKGFIRSVESMSVNILRSIEDKAASQADSQIHVYLPKDVAFYLFNRKRGHIQDIELTHNVTIQLHEDTQMMAEEFRVESEKTAGKSRNSNRKDRKKNERVKQAQTKAAEQSKAEESEAEKEDGKSNRNRRRRRGKGNKPESTTDTPQAEKPQQEADKASDTAQDSDKEKSERKGRGRRRRGRGRRKEEGSESKTDSNSSAENQNAKPAESPKTESAPAKETPKKDDKPKRKGWWDKLLS